MRVHVAAREGVRRGRRGRRVVVGRCIFFGVGCGCDV